MGVYWHRAWFGSWNEPHGVQRLDGSYSKKDIMERAKKTANETGKTVTVETVIQTMRGIESRFEFVHPEVREN